MYLYPQFDLKPKMDDVAIAIQNPFMVPAHQPWVSWICKVKSKVDFGEGEAWKL